MLATAVASGADERLSALSPEPREPRHPHRRGPRVRRGRARRALEPGGGRWLSAVALALLPVLSVAAHGVGHRREVNPPIPFRGPADFVARLLTEQFYLPTVRAQRRLAPGVARQRVSAGSRITRRSDRPGASS